MEIVVETAEAGKRLDHLLAERIPELSRMWLRQAIEEGRATVNGAVQPPGNRVCLGDRVEVELPELAGTAMCPEPIPLRVLCEDAALAVVEKPSDMVMHPAGRHRSGTLANALAHHFNVAGGAIPPVRPGLVHRLDRATSGLVVVAKTQRALSRLTIDFQNKLVEKRYLALVHGPVAAESGDWEAPIGSDPEATPRWGIRETGRPAHTRYRVRARGPAFTLLELEPVTGRTNQLRLHCAHFGHPIAGDELFGRGPLPGLARLFLHAYRLGFRHPETREWTVFETGLPAELAEFLSQALSVEP